jgi:hypothetical protein
MEMKALASETELAVASTSNGAMKRGGGSSNCQKKHSLGRQKIPIKRIQKEDARQVLLFHPHNSFYFVHEFFCN